MHDECNEQLDGLFRAVRALKPDTAAVEEGFETRLLAVIEQRRNNGHGTGLGLLGMREPEGATNRLYKNNRDGTFTDVAEKAGLTGVDPKLGKTWSICAGWFDYDRDGWLDLFVVNYCVWGLDKDPYCSHSRKSGRSYCSPEEFKGLPNMLFHNNHDGTFTDVSALSGIANHTGKGMGVAFADYDDDGYPDVFVANDTTRNSMSQARRASCESARRRADAPRSGDHQEDVGGLGHHLARPAEKSWPEGRDHAGGERGAGPEEFRAEKEEGNDEEVGLGRVADRLPVPPGRDPITNAPRGALPFVH